MIKVSFLDSGIGGLSYCNEFRDTYPEYSVDYIADCKYFPYGKHNARVLQERVSQLAYTVQETLHADMLVIACNTASVTSLSCVRKKLRIPVIGVVPAIKLVQKEQRKRLYMMSTVLTKNDKYTEKLLHDFGADITVFLRGFPELVENIEQMVLQQSSAYANHVSSILEKIVLEIRALNIDSVLLACTHFLFVMKNLLALLPSNVRVYHSLEGVLMQISKVAKKLFVEKKQTGEAETKGTSGIYVTDDSQKKAYQNYAESNGLEFKGEI